MPGWILAAFDTRISTGPNAASASLAKRVDRRRVRQVEMAGHRLPALGPDGRGHLLAGLDAARPEHDRMARPGQRPRRLGADARRGARDRRWAGVRGGARSAASARRHRGRERGEPRTLMECTRCIPAGSTS